jgi:hypothetical protein
LKPVTNPSSHSMYSAFSLTRSPSPVCILRSLPGGFLPMVAINSAREKHRPAHAAHCWESARRGGADPMAKPFGAKGSG